MAKTLRGDVRLPRSAHTSRAWRIHEVARGFRVEDVWALPTPGGPGDFPLLVEGAASLDPSRVDSVAVRILVAIRLKLGELLRWDERAAGPDSPTLRDRVPADLRGLPPGPQFEATPFVPLYVTHDELAAEVVNETVHAVLHLGWVPDEAGGHRGQLAILVKPNGLLGTVYMAAIRPFRHLVVYPALMREIDRTWRRTAGGPAGR